MFSRYRERARNVLRVVATMMLCLPFVSCVPGKTSGEVPLRVCADPNNLPFSNNRLEGFENRIAELIASELHKPLRYTWWAQRRGFFRNTLNAGVCDLVVGVPSGVELAQTTSPYYRSGYAFVTRRDRALNIRSFDDPRLRQLLIGVQLVGEDFATTPPAVVLSHRGIIENVRGYTVFGDYAQPNPPARIIDAVAEGLIDVALAWGPLAGYFAGRENVPLDVVVARDDDSAFPPLSFNISMGVRKNETRLKQQLEQILVSRKSQIDEILDAYNVPRMSKSVPLTRLRSAKE